MVGNVSWSGDTLVEGVEHVEGSGEKAEFIARRNFRLFSIHETISVAP